MFYENLEFIWNIYLTCARFHATIQPEQGRNPPEAQYRKAEVKRQRPKAEGRPEDQKM